MTERPERRGNKRSNSVSEVNDQLSVDPTSTQTWLRLGEVYISKYNYQEALDCFETALYIESKPGKNQFNAIRNHLREGSYDRARQSLVRIKETGWQNYRKPKNIQ